MKKIIIIILLSLFTFTTSCAESPTMPKYTGERVEINFTYNNRAGSGVINLFFGLKTVQANT